MTMSASPRGHTQPLPYYKQELGHHYQHPHPPQSPPQDRYRAKRPRQLSPGPETHDTPPLSASVSASVPSPASEEPQDGGSVVSGAACGVTTKAGQSSSFRNVSACERCRMRKNRCDQRLPSCMSCEKAGVSCIGYDPITKQRVPRRQSMVLKPGLT